MQRLQIVDHPRHREEETQNNDSHDATSPLLSECQMTKTKHQTYTHIETTTQDG